MGNYVSNGMLIAAAYALGFRVATDGDGRTHTSTCPKKLSISIRRRAPRERPHRPPASPGRFDHHNGPAGPPDSPGGHSSRLPAGAAYTAPSAAAARSLLPAAVMERYAPPCCVLDAAPEQADARAAVLDAAWITIPGWNA